MSFGPAYRQSVAAGDSSATVAMNDSSVKPDPDSVHALLKGAFTIGSGKSGEVLKLRDRTVLKIFGPTIPFGVAKREFRAAIVIRKLGVPGADPIETLTIGERPAIRRTFVPGHQVLGRVKRNPVRMTWALARLAWLQAKLNTIRVPEDSLPQGKAVLVERIKSSHAGTNAVDHALAAVTNLPDGDRLCHGDLHLGNVIAFRGRWTVIDWARATAGTSASDAARTILLIRYGALFHADRLVLIRALRWISAHFYTLCYCFFARTSPARLREWELPLAVSWMQGQGTYREASLARMIARRLR